MTRPTVAALDDAREASLALLLPFDARRWLRLAVLALFVGGGGGVPAARGNLEAPALSGPGPAPAPDLPDPSTLPAVAPSSVLALALAVVLVAAVLGLAYVVASGVAEYVLLVAVRDRAVRLRAPARTHLGRGVRLAGFRAAVWLAALAVVGVPAALVVVGVVAFSPLTLLLAVPLVFLALTVLVAAWLVLRLTTDFAVPTTLALDVGLVDAWRRLARTLRADPLEVGLYLLVRVALGVAAGVATGLVAGLAALVVAVPFAVLGLVGYVVAGPPLGVAGLVALGLLAAAYALVALALWLLVRVPVVVYLRAFSLAALGRLDADLDLLGVAVDGPSAADGDANDGERAGGA
ncbi:MAG: hypothetical protein ABEH47_02980 [Haloferacaceae archaeon]